MATIITFNNYKEFYLHNLENLKEQFIASFYLIHLMDEVRQGKLGWHEFFNMTDVDGSQLVALKAGDLFLLFSPRWNEQMMAELSAKINFDRYRRFLFGGYKSFLQALFAANGSAFHNIKDRISYRCDRVSAAFQRSSGRPEMAQMADLDELAQLSFQYSQEEYHGRGRPYDHMREVVAGGIVNDNFYAWRDAGVLCAIAQVIENGKEVPFIGHLFTRPERRNHGYARSLLHVITEGLLTEGHKACGLVSDATNPAANALFQKVGYVPVGTYVTATKEKWVEQDLT